MVVYIHKLEVQVYDVRMHEKSPYSIGRGHQVAAQEFKFSTSKNVFEALKFGFLSSTRVHVDFDCTKLNNIVHSCKNVFETNSSNLTFIHLHCFYFLNISTLLLLQFLNR